MPLQLPILPAIAEPCNQPWELMPGTARVRHCSRCNQDVHNTAALSAAEITELLRGPLPCLRIVRHDDGTIVTTEPPAPHARPRLAAGLLAAAVAFGPAAAQDKPRGTATLGVPSVAPPQALIYGRVTDHAGHPLANSTATLLRDGHLVSTVHLGPDGQYSLAAPAGRYDLRVEAPGSATRTLSVQLAPDKPLTEPVQLTQPPAVVGRIAPPPHPAPTMGKPIQRRK